MNPDLIYYPCFALLLWTLVILLWMFVMRVQGLKKGQVDFRYFKTYDTGQTLPVKMVQAGRNFSNLFEVPTLFYMVCAFSLITENVDQITIYLSWCYVVLRMLHSLIHVTSNKIMVRMTFFALSCAVLFVMATRLALMVN